jgi:hypothetical protein
MPLPTLYDQTLARLYGQLPDQQQPMMQTGFHQPSPIQPLAPEEESGVLNRIGGAVSSGLGYIGGSLGKALGGRAIRGLLGGRPEELASVIPFSDTLGITNPTNEVTGAELLGNKDADLLSPTGLGGMAAEILLDPATYLSFGGGALSKLGGVAQKAGVLPETIAGRIAGVAAGTREADTLARAAAGTLGHIGPVAPQQVADVAGKALGGHIGVGLPFMGNAATADLRPVGNALSNALGAIPGGQAIKNIGSAVGDAAQPFISGARALFDKRVQGMTDPFLADVLAKEYSDKLPGLMVQTRQDVRPLVEHANVAGLLNEPGGRALGDVFEGAAPAIGPMREMADYKNTLMKQLQGELQSAQLPTTNLTPQNILSGAGAGQPMEYAPRQLAQEFYEGKGARPKVLAPAAAQARIEATEGLTRSRLSDLAKENMEGLSPLQIQEKIRTDYLGLPPQVHVDLRDLKNTLAAEKEAAGQAQQVVAAAGVMDQRKQLMPDLAQAAGNAQQKLTASQATIQATTDRISEIETRLAQAADLAKYKLEGKVPEFNHPIEDVASKVFRDRQRALKADAFHTAVAGLAVPKAEAGQGAVSFVDALQRGGLTPGQGLMQKTQDALERLGKNPKNLEDMWLKPEDLKPLTNWLEGTRTPKGLEPFLNAWDSVTNLTKAWQTAAWPGNWTRNFLTDQFMHWVTDGSSSTGQMVKDLADARILHSGTGVLQDANKIQGLQHLSPQEATLELQRMMVDHGVMGQGRLLSDTVGMPGEGVRLQDLIPNRERQGPIGAYKTALDEGTWNPLGVRGVGGRETDTNKLVAGGRNVNETLSDLSRAQTFLGKLRQGFTPEMAMEAVVKAHYDFSQLSDFERNIMKRVIPFYSWARNNVPTILQDYAENPGGKLATVSKAAGRARGAEPGFLPPQIGEGVALPVTSEDETGTKRFFTRTGLPFEDLAQMTTGSDYLGMLNPLLKAPLELATGRQFFTGRDIRDLRSDTGSTLLDQALANSPLGRFATTGRTLVDERKDALSKAINLVSGTHLSDVNMQQARDIAVRNFITDQLRGQPEIGQHLDLYARPDQLGNLTPQELLMLRLQKTRDAEQRQQARIGVRVGP